MLVRTSQSNVTRSNVHCNALRPRAHMRMMMKTKAASSLCLFLVSLFKLSCCGKDGAVERGRRPDGDDAVLPFYRKCNSFCLKNNFWSKRQLFVKNNNSPRNLASSKKRLHNPHRRSLVSGFSALSAFVAVVESSDHGGLVP